MLTNFAAEFNSSDLWLSDLSWICLCSDSQLQMSGNSSDFVYFFSYLPRDLLSVGWSRMVSIITTWCNSACIMSFILHLAIPRASQMPQWVKNLPAMQEAQETQVRSLSQEDPLEKGVATYSSILAWRIPWTEEPGSL